MPHVSVQWKRTTSVPLGSDPESFREGFPVTQVILISESLAGGKMDKSIILAKCGDPRLALYRALFNLRRPSNEKSLSITRLFTNMSK